MENGASAQREVVDIVRGSDFREGVSCSAGTAVDAGGVHRRHERRVGPDHDDRRAGLQMLEAGVHQVEHADQIDVHRIGEGLRRQARRQRTDAGVGDHDVEMTELRDAPVDRRRQCRAVTDVGDLGDDALALLLDQTRGFVEIFRPGQRVLVRFDVLAQVHRDDVGALGGEHSRMRAALTTRGSADYRDLACHPAHSRSFLMRSTKTNLHWGSGIRFARVVAESRQAALTRPSIGTGRAFDSIASLPRRCVIAVQADKYL